MYQFVAAPGHTDKFLASLACPHGAPLARLCRHLERLAGSPSEPRPRLAVGSVTCRKQGALGLSRRQELELAPG